MTSLGASQIQEVAREGGGEGGGSSGALVAASAREAWWAAARWLRRALACLPRWRRRRPDAGCEVVEADAGRDEVGGAVLQNSIASFTLDLPPLVERVKEAFPPDSSTS